MKEQKAGTLRTGMRISLMVICAALMIWKVTTAPAADASKRDETPVQTRAVAKQALPRLDGNHLEMQLLEVIYQPGQSSKPHSHPCAVIGYVVEGAVRMQLQGKTEIVYRAGESFYESPNEIHLVSANASETEPAKFLACFLCDHETPLSVPVPTSQPAKGE